MPVESYLLSTSRTTPLKTRTTKLTQTTVVVSAGGRFVSFPSVFNCQWQAKRWFIIHYIARATPRAVTPRCQNTEIRQDSGTLSRQGLPCLWNALWMDVHHRCALLSLHRHFFRVRETVLNLFYGMHDVGIIPGAGDVADAALNYLLIVSKARQAEYVIFYHRPFTSPFPIRLT